MQEIIKISDKLSVPRVLIGLWQIADMEKDGKTLDPDVTSKYMNLYAKNGFTSFDMADHYGSSEIIAGVFKNNYQNNSYKNYCVNCKLIKSFPCFCLIFSYIIFIIIHGL